MAEYVCEHGGVCLTRHPGGEDYVSERGRRPDSFTEIQLGEFAMKSFCGLS